MIAVEQIIIYILVYLVPSFFLFGLASMVLINNPSRNVNRLVAALIIIYSSIMLEEFVRHLLPMPYNPFMTKFVLGFLGAVSMSVTVHLYYNLSFENFKYKLPFYPYVFYIPVVFHLLIVLFVSDTLGAEGYYRVGIWYHHANGYFYEWAVTAINIMFLISIALLLGGLRRNQSHEKKRLLRFLLYGTIGLLITNSLVGYFLSREQLPPYLIIFESILSAIILVVSAFRYRLLPSIMSRYEMIFNLTPTSILMLNSDLEIMELNDNAKKMFRWKQNAERNLYELLRRGHNQLQIEMIVKELEVSSTIHDFVLMIKHVTKNKVYHVSVDASVSMVGDEKFYYIAWRDVTQEIEREQLISHLAYHDALTNLHNRGYFVDKVQQEIARLSTMDQPQLAAFVLIDLNYFKEINDTYGHSVGDEVLQHTAFILSEAIEEKYEVARFGGDEFVIFIPSIETKEELIEWVKRLRLYFKMTPYMHNELEIVIEPSIGIAYFPDNGVTFEELYHIVDQQMYEDKQKMKA